MRQLIVSIIPADRFELQNAQHGFLTRFAAMLHNKSLVFVACFPKLQSPRVKESKTNLVSEFHAVGFSGFRIIIILMGFRILLSCIPDSTKKKFSDSGFHNQRFFRRGSPIGYFNPVTLTQNFVQSRNPEDYFWHPISQAHFQSRNSPRFCFQIPSPEL